MKKLNNNDSSKYVRSDIFSNIIKYFSRDSVGIKILFIVGILAILLGIWQMIFNIKTSFVLRPTQLKDTAGMIENLNKLKDTDSDGISDYDELNVYNTSPYLTDTNSNGLSDYEEIILGQGTASTGTCIGSNCPQITSSSSIVNSDLQKSIGADVSNMTLEQFKQELIESGYDSGLVSQITESDFEEIKQQINQKSAITPSQTTIASSTLEQLKNLSVVEIRQLLKSQGMTDEELKKLSDEQLKTMFIQTLEDAAKEQTTQSNQ